MSSSTYSLDEGALRALVQGKTQLEVWMALVNDPDLQFACSLLLVRGNASLAEAMCHLFQVHHEYHLLFIKRIVELEVSSVSAESATELFRSSSMPTRLLSSFCRSTAGIKYLQHALREPLETQCQCQCDWEIDPARMVDVSAAAANCAQLMSTAQHVLDSILASAGECPDDLCMLCYYVRSSVATRFEEHADSCVGGIFFLRFICPSVVLPHQYDVVREKPTKESQRGLTLLAKILQTLANHVLFTEKESYLLEFNPFIERNYSQVVMFYDKLCERAQEQQHRATAAVDREGTGRQTYDQSDQRAAGLYRDGLHAPAISITSLSVQDEAALDVIQAVVCGKQSSKKKATQPQQPTGKEQGRRRRRGSGTGSAPACVSM
jgi:hypothetical protein